MLAKRPVRTVRQKPIIDESASEIPRSHVVTTRTISRAYGRAVAGFTLVAIILAGVILMITGSRATVIITPKTNQIDVPFTIAVMPGAVSSTANALPGRLLELATSTSITVNITAPTSTSTDPNAKANGTVTITNRSGTPQALVATTRLLTKDNLLFRLQRTVTVPANGQITEAVQADQPGEQYAIPPSSFTIPGLNPSRQQQVTASSDQSFTLQAVTQDGLTADQITTAKSQALAVAGTQLSGALRSLLFNNENITPESITTTPLEFNTSAKIGSAITSITFTGTVRVSAILFNEQNMRQLAATIAKKEQPKGEVNAGSLVYVVQRAGGGANLGSISGHVAVRTSKVTLETKDLTGRTKQDAAVFVQLLPGVEQVEIKLKPLWFRRLPQDPNRITIIINPLR
jgi:hypothetical protein